MVAAAVVLPAMVVLVGVGLRVLTEVHVGVGKLAEVVAAAVMEVGMEMDVQAAALKAETLAETAVAEDVLGGAANSPPLALAAAAAVVVAAPAGVAVAQVAAMAAVERQGWAAAAMEAEGERQGKVGVVMAAGVVAVAHMAAMVVG